MNFSQLISGDGLFSDGDWIEKKDQDVNGRVRLIQLADIGDGYFKDKSSRYVTEETASRLNCTFLEQGDILIARLPDPLGRACIFPFKGQYITAVDIAILRIKNRLYNPRYIMYLINSPQFRKSISRYESGTTRKRISRRNLDRIQFNVPDITVQERIVSKIEELFSRLDASVAELQTAKEKLKVYRQAVLKEAFDSVQANSKRVTIKSVCETIKVGIVIKPTQYYVEQGGVFAFRNANVRRNYIEDKDWAMISQEGHQKNLKSQVHIGDVLIARSGVNLGMAATVPQKYDGYNAIDVVIAVPKKEFILSQYLAQYTNSPYGLEIVRKNQHGAAQGHLNVKEYGNLPIFLPNIPEQYSLLKKIESRLSVCDNIEQTIDTSLQQAEALRQSILKQAFEGALAT